jgi:hypothetical protein
VMNPARQRQPAETQLFGRSQHLGLVPRRRNVKP